MFSFFQKKVEKVEEVNEVKEEKRLRFVTL